jgi:hypothetical protein
MVKFDLTGTGYDDKTKTLFMPEVIDDSTFVSNLSCKKCLYMALPKIIKSSADKFTKSMDALKQANNMPRLDSLMCFLLIQSMYKYNVMSSTSPDAPTMAQLQSPLLLVPDNKVTHVCQQSGQQCSSSPRTSEQA